MSKTKDDGNDRDFKRRLEEYHAAQLELRNGGKFSDLDEHYHDVSPGFRVTSWMWNRLYKYQKTGVRWLLKLHEQYVGGILADEMGLGKTIQIAIFLRCIAESEQMSRIFDYTGLGPVLVIAPTTLMGQWVTELNKWFPRCRTAIFHSSGSFDGSRSSLLRKMSVPRSSGSVLITSYTTFTMFKSDFKKINWHYVILDEGHKIRNPDAKTTIALKEIRTPHRLLLSGSPLQNNLRELWSLIDFVYPGRLGSLKEFSDRFVNPINHGGYANATKLQVRVAYKCACLLRDAMNPYLMQRFKKDVEMTLNLPGKSEQILFCDLTPFQRDLYKEYIASKEIKSILAGRIDAFVGLINLRKLCNHPDLITGGPNRDDNHLEKSESLEDEFGAASRSGKLIVVQSLLKLWYKQKQKVLLFSQSRQMLSILEKLIVMMGYRYLRMDGSTPIGSRQRLVGRFNNSPEIFIFLLTTRVGGLGLNLTGANRVIIYDPDWNPSTDSQAKERAWRIGQNRSVTIYRLMTSGTIEEKIYQRQIFKQFLARRILVDPKQKRFFKTNDLHELFTLGDERVDKQHGTETAAIFSDKPAEINKNNFFDELAKKKGNMKKAKGQKKRADEGEEDTSDVDDFEITLTEEYKEQLREKARLYAKLLSENNVIMTTMEQIESAEQDEPMVFEQRELVEENTSEDEKKFPSDEEPEIPLILPQKELQDDESGRKPKKRLLDGKFEIKYLRKQKPYRPPVDEADKQSKDQDVYVLKHLLEKAGVHSAIIHDQIVNESGEDNADMQLIEEEANNVARRAAEVLKRSHKQHQNFVEMACASSNKIFGQKKANVFMDNDSDQPQGSNTQPSSSSPSNNDDDESLPAMFNGGMKRKRDPENDDDSEALSSNQLSNIIKRRRYEQLENVEVCEDKGEDIPDEIRMFPSLIPKQRKPDIFLNDKYEKLAEAVRKFFVSKEGRATSNEVVTKFKDNVPPQDSFVFRSILRKLCLQLPNGHWALHEEFR